MGNDSDSRFEVPDSIVTEDDRMDTDDGNENLQIGVDDPMDNVERRTW